MFDWLTQQVKTHDILVLIVLWKCWTRSNLMGFRLLFMKLLSSVMLFIVIHVKLSCKFLG